MAQDKVANEHYVPRAYLKAYANEKQQCFVYDKLKDKIFSTNIQGILSQRYLYDFDKELLGEFPNVDEQAVEKVLGATIDSYWKNIVDNIDKNYQWFSVKYLGHFLDVYRCAAIQMMRTPKGKKNLLDIYNEVYRKKQDARYENIVLAKEIINVLDDNMESVLLDMLLNEYGHITIGINETSIPFVTSDTPVFQMPYVWDENKQEMMIFYPITPTRCIIFHKRNYVESLLNAVINETAIGRFEIKDLSDITQEAYRREKEQLSRLNPESRVLKEEEVLVMNTCCVRLAERYVICNCNPEKTKLWLCS
jgi:hypothetical protein